MNHVVYIYTGRFQMQTGINHRSLCETYGKPMLKRIFKNRKQQLTKNNTKNKTWENIDIEREKIKTNEESLCYLLLCLHRSQLP